MNQLANAAETRSAEEPWQVLGLRTSSPTPDQVEDAYRRLAMEHHPDRGGNAEQMKRLNAARKALLDRVANCELSRTERARKERDSAGQKVADRIMAAVRTKGGPFEVQGGNYTVCVTGLASGSVAMNWSTNAPGTPDRRREVHVFTRSEEREFPLAPGFVKFDFAPMELAESVNVSLTRAPRPSKTPDPREVRSADLAGRVVDLERQVAGKHKTTKHT